jgi:hypothetical protein
MAQAHGENLKQAMDTLRAHKLRSALTVFGVVLGVSVIMLVAALITGFDQAIQEDIKQYGADTAFISRWDQGPHNQNRPLEERLRKPLTLEDAEALKASCPAVKNVTVYVNWWEKPHVIRTKAGEVTATDLRRGLRQRRHAFRAFPERRRRSAPRESRHAWGKCRTGIVS